MRRVIKPCAFVALVCVAACFAGQSAYEQGDMIGQAGVSTLSFGPHVTFEYGIHELVSVGGGIGFVFPYFERFQVPVTVRGAFHPFNLPILIDKIPVRDKADVYVGPVMGWEIPGWPIFRPLLGVRWYFTETFAVFAEEGGGFGWLAGGVVLKF